MVKFDSKIVMRNGEFGKENYRFHSTLKSEAFSGLDVNQKRLLNLIPGFIAMGHPYIFLHDKPTGESGLIFGKRKDGITAYAAHPLNVVNILLDFRFTNPSQLFVGAGHDFTEEQESLRDKLKAKGEHHDFIDLYNSPLDFTDKYLIDKYLQRKINRKGLEDAISETFYDDVKEGIFYLTPSKSWEDDFKHFTPDSFYYFAKVADSLSVNRDCENMVMKHLGYKEAQLNKLDERLGKMDMLLEHSKDVQELHGKNSAQRSIILALGFCYDFVSNFRDKLELSPVMNREELHITRMETLNEHPIYAKISYANN